MQVFREQGKLDRAPAVETCIQWEMKLGLHKLMRPKEAANDWIWIIDHVVSKGVHKCLVVLGVRMASLLKRDDLTVSFEDVEPLGIVPMKSSNGGLMETELKTVLSTNHGIPPLAILRDDGPDLRCGGRLFCEAYPQVIDAEDIPHKIACLYKHWLGNDKLWKEFTKKCSDFKKQVQLTEYAKIAPPNQRTKARYHNVDVIVDWGISKLLKYESLPKSEQEKLSWLGDYEGELSYWKQLVDIGRVGRNFTRKKGLWLGCHEELAEELVEEEICPRAEPFACNLIDVVEKQGNKVPEGKKIIGSTEIIESLFGKHKSISERGPKPMGRLILSMASRVGEQPTEELIELAFGQVRERDIDSWLTNMFC